MRAVALALWIAAVGGCVPLFAQVPQVDYTLAIVTVGPPIAGGEVVYALAVSANYWTDRSEPFTVRLQVPPELELVSLDCFGEPSQDLRFDAATRVLTWSGRLDNPYIAFKSCPLRMRINPALAPGTTFELTATLTTASADQNAANNIASHGSVVLPVSDLAVVSSADAERFRPGTTFRYTFTVTNHGPHNAQQVTVADHLSPHVTFVSFEQLSGPAATLDGAPRDGAITANIPQLAKGTSATFRLTVQATAVVESANILNRIVASSASVDLADRDNEHGLVTFAGPRADLAATSSGPLYETGMRLPITVTVSNNGPDSVNSVTVENTLSGTRWEFIETARCLAATPSQGTCSAPERVLQYGHPPGPSYWRIQCDLGALAPGATATISLLIERSPNTGRLDQAATVRPSQNDPVTRNNYTQATYTLPNPRRRSTRH